MTIPKMYHKVLLLDDESDDTGTAVVTGPVVSVDASVRTMAFSETTFSPFVLVTRIESFDAVFGIFTEVPAVTAVHEPSET